MKKIIICIFLVFLCSGCSVTYNLEINENDFQENISIYSQEDSTETYDGTNIFDFYNLQKNERIPKYFDHGYDLEYYTGTISEDLLYKVEDYSNEENRGIQLSANFDDTDFYRSAAIKQCFEELDRQKENGYVLLRTNNKCNLFETYPILENITIRIKTDLEVIASNADNVDDNVYIWDINRNNYNNKSIHLTYVLPGSIKKPEEQQPITPEENVEENKEEVVENTEEGNYNIFLILGSFVVLALVIYFVLKYKNK